ncbi:uncharacterized protein K444DRAFT_707604, partial [Hyaloscypha bicolor E]
VEDYCPGYPRFSALVASHNSFQLCRRFSNLRARLLLLKQDRLSMLERQLAEIDTEETTALFLGSSRCDNNVQRTAVLSDIDVALADYGKLLADEFVERNHRMISFDVAKPRDILNLQNWVKGNACLAREETAYLANGPDLMSMAFSDDLALTRLEAWVEDFLIRFHPRFRGNSSLAGSRDPHVYIFSGVLLTRLTRTLIIVLLVVLLFVPVIICNALSGITSRIVVIVIASIFFIITLSGLTKANTGAMFVSGAT